MVFTLKPDEINCKQKFRNCNNTNPPALSYFDLSISVKIPIPNSDQLKL